MPIDVTTISLFVFVVVLLYEARLLWGKPRSATPVAPEPAAAEEAPELAPERAALEYSRLLRLVPVAYRIERSSAAR